MNLENMFSSLHVHTVSCILLNDLAIADSYAHSHSFQRTNLLLQLHDGLAGSTWCVEHHRTVIERMVNAFPPAWLLPPSTGEIFDSLEQYNRRLKDFFRKAEKGLQANKLWSCATKYCRRKRLDTLDRSRKVNRSY